MFLPICFPNFTNLSQFEQLKKKTNSLLVQIIFFLSLSVEKVIITNILQQNWQIQNSKLEKLSDEAHQSTFFEIIHNSRKALGDGTADQK